MDINKKADAKAVTQDLVVNLAKLAIALCVMAYCLGGATTRAWMNGFVRGTVSGFGGEPTRSLAGSITSDEPPLRLLGRTCRQEYGYQTCEGEVRNVSGTRLDNVMAVVSFKDKAGTFIKSQSSLIEYQPLMPGQTSPFKVMTTGNPQIWHFSIGFKEMFGGELKAAR